MSGAHGSGGSRLIAPGGSTGTATATANAVGARWTGDAGVAGSVAVIGLGKIGLPIAAQYAAAGWTVHGVDVRQDLLARLERGDVPVDEPGLADRLRSARGAGLFRVTADHAAAVAHADVVVIVVPLALDADARPDFTRLDDATEAVGRALRRGTLVVYETTLPIGTTRQRLAPALAAASGLVPGDAVAGFLLAFSPERVSSGRVFRDLATYPKLVGGVDPASAERASAFYRAVLPAEVWQLSSAEAAEFAKLAETTYRDVNIALATEFAHVAERVGLDVLEVIEAANSQPYSRIHAPGMGVGGHCIPVYPHFLLGREPGLRLPSAAREINDAEVDRAVARVRAHLGSLSGVEVLVLGLTYRAGVAEPGYSRALPLIERLRAAGADVIAWDPLLGPSELAGSGARPWIWGTVSPARAVFVQTADERFRELDAVAWLPELRVLYDGRNTLRGIALPHRAVYLGVGAPDRAG